MVGKWVGIGAIGLFGANILTLAPRPVALFVGGDNWVQVDGSDVKKMDALSYSVNDSLRNIAWHWAYPTVLSITLPPGQGDASVRSRFSASKESLPAVLRVNGLDRELLVYTSNPKAAADQARRTGLRYTTSLDPEWSIYRKYSLAR